MNSFSISIINIYMCMAIKTVNLTSPAAKLKHNITEDDKRRTGEGKQRYRLKMT